MSDIVQRIRSTHCGTSLEVANKMTDLADEAATEIDRLRTWGREALEVIKRGSELMTLEQVSAWEGCRAVVESFELAMGAEDD
ncbi:MAG: hypothetical protein ABF271_12820 [Abyssibacter sp.]|uniref:hypothetical protein n=1 Tax=Abyssibacter sp. TaxID=2320200 RepID=UPI00321A1520